MKIYTIYTETHEQMYTQYFLATLPSELTLIPYLAPNYSATGSYMENGWHQIMLEKLKLILRAIDENWGSLFIYADCDIEFFGDVEEQLVKELEDYDIALQSDISVYCAGFFIARANEENKKMFQEVIDNYNEYRDDQHGLNLIIHKYNAKKLPSRFWNLGIATGGVVHDKNITLDIPKDLLIYHANWLIGTEMKTHFLERVKNEFTNLR